MLLILFTFSVLILISFSCSSSKQNNEEEKGEDEIYIFDEVPLDDSTPDVIVPKEIERNYVIQIGAFSSKQNADKFADKSKLILSEEVTVDYNERINMYVVTLTRIFNSRTTAVNQRNELWKYKQFSDAWLREVK